MECAGLDGALDLLKGPDIKTVVKDKKQRITYVILAYRPVDQHEALDAVATFHSHLKKKRKSPEPGQTYTILTTYH